jgi:hypothetical protein
MGETGAPHLKDIWDFGIYVEQHCGEAKTPILWDLLNQLILTALGEKFECITLVSLDKSKTSTRPGDSFVDDTRT